MTNNILTAETKFGATGRLDPRLVHVSDAMREVSALLEKVGPTSAAVLIVGETGTGKELCARALHDLSQRSGPFFAVDCGAVPETLLDNALFGHEKGAFTGASERRIGYFEQADGGTLFLDELSSMPLASQAKLMRVLEERAFRRLGGVDQVAVDTRIIAAMNEPPEQAVERGHLREDLYYRINVVTVKVSPLRERLDDLPALVDGLLRELGSKHGIRVHTVDPAVRRALSSYAWPGNVRELRNVIERALILSTGERLSLESLPPEISSISLPLTAREAPSRPSEPEPGPATPWVGSTLEEVTRALVCDTLEAVGFNKSKAARMLGVSPKTIYNKLKEWDAEVPEAPLRDDDGLDARGNGGRVVRGGFDVRKDDSAAARR